MLLHAWIVPPRAALEAVAEAVRSADRTAVPVARAPQKRFLRRLGGRGVHTADSPIATGRELDLIPVEHMYLPVAGFGNLTSKDTLRVADALTDAAADWAGAKLHIAGGTVLDIPGDRSVWAKLDGDVEGLTTIARGVTQRVQDLGFRFDRRVFRPLLAVATTTGATTTPHLQAVLDALNAFRGEDWTIEHVSLMKRSYDVQTPESREVFRIRLAPA